MKVVFLLDNNEYIESAPEKLQIRQLQPGVAALGIEVTVPVNGADGKPETHEDGTTKMQQGFRPIVNYNVNLSIPEPPKAEAVAVPAAPQPALEAVKPNGKAKPVAKVVAKKAAKKR
jgi:hypothetical protein